MGNAIISARSLSKEFSGFTAVRNFSIDVREGSIHALIGPNGAGKTTVFNLLTRFMPLTRGRIYFRGSDITNSRPAHVARLGMVRSFQISAIFPHLSVRDNLLVALQRPAGLAVQFWSSKRRLFSLHSKADELIQAVNLTPFAERRASELSYGRKRALEIATTLALEPTLLLLDEPTAGMAQEDIARITGLIKEIAANRTVLMVEHNLNVVADLCDRITVMQRGEILADGTYDQISTDPRVQEAYLGNDHA